jgi:leucyl aminopeptidase
LDSPIADISSTGHDGSHAGAINAALFLSEFVSSTTPWLHIDLAAWNGTNRPGRPKGGEAQVLRALYAMIAERAGAGAKRAGKRKRRR